MTTLAMVCKLQAFPNQGTLRRVLHFRSIRNVHVCVKRKLYCMQIAWTSLHNLYKPEQ